MRSAPKCGKNVASLNCEKLPSGFQPSKSSVFILGRRNTAKGSVFRIPAENPQNVAGPCVDFKSTQLLETIIENKPTLESILTRGWNVSHCLASSSSLGGDSGSVSHFGSGPAGPDVTPADRVNEV